MEESIEQTQKSENCIAEFQRWLETTDQQLTSRIQNDFSPQDLPNDVEVIFLFFTFKCFITIYIDHWSSVQNLENSTIYLFYYFVI